MIKLIRLLCYILEKKDDFDWGKYLMEGEEIGLGPDVDTPVSGCGFAIAHINTCPHGSNNLSVPFHQRACYLKRNSLSFSGKGAY